MSPRPPTARPGFISFYCGDPYYARAAEALRVRCETLGIPITVEPLTDRGCYWRNTLLKPGFIRDQLAARRRDLFWIDADTQLHADHPHFHRIGADLAVASHTGDLSGVKASPIGFAYNPRTLAFLTAWAAACDARLAADDVDLDHDILKYEILPAFIGKVTLRLMGDPTDPRALTEGRILTNGLSRKSAADLSPVLDRNRLRQGGFTGLHLEHFARPAPETGSRAGLNE